MFEAAAGEARNQEAEVRALLFDAMRIAAILSATDAALSPQAALGAEA